MVVSANRMVSEVLFVFVNLRIVVYVAKFLIRVPIIHAVITDNVDQVMVGFIANVTLDIMAIDAIVKFAFLIPVRMVVHVNHVLTVSFNVFAHPNIKDNVVNFEKFANQIHVLMVVPVVRMVLILIHVIVHSDILVVIVRHVIHVFQIRVKMVGDVEQTWDQLHTHATVQ